MRSILEKLSLINKTSIRLQKNNFAAWSRSYPAYSHSNDNFSQNSTKLEELRKKLKEDKLFSRFEISPRGKRFLKEISSNNLNTKYSRGGKNGEGYVGIEEVLDKTENIYPKEEKEEILNNSNKIQSRMRVKASKPYIDYAIKTTPDNAKYPNPILKIILPQNQEIINLTGESDPSNQNRFSPLPGLLHKYEMLLAFTSINCSSHCRYCYRLDLFSGISSKSKADMATIAAYIKTYNELVDQTIETEGLWNEKSGLYIHKTTEEPLLHAREILFSGGDPLTLPNATLARYMSLMAESGITSIRVGTKELSFNPDRFDRNFWQMMDLFHETYPEIRVEIVGHYTHPFELVEAKTDRHGEYLYDLRSKYRTREDLLLPLHEIERRGSWIGHYNQFPIIAKINDSPEILRLLMYQCQRLGIKMHNIYACREIPGNQHFREENTIERQYELVENAKNGLSGIENHARLIMSTEYGKVEVCGIEENSVLLKLNRYINSNKPDKTIIRVDTHKLQQELKFYWLNDEVIKRAVSPEGQEILEELEKEKNSLVKQIKNKAVDLIKDNNLKLFNKKLVNQSTEDEKISHYRKESSVTIELVENKGGSRIIEIDLKDEKYKNKKTTIATVLSENKEVEAACKEQLSCSTCVGEIESDNKLPEISEDEKDLVDSISQTPSKSIQPRAGCQIILEPGKYKFTKLN